jgi:hypothetical protein
MKKIFMMCAFAGFTAFAATAQTEPTAATTSKATDKKEHCVGTAKMCTPAEKAACTSEAAKSCCAKGSAKSTSMAAKTDKADVKKTPATNK